MKYCFHIFIFLIAMIPATAQENRLKSPLSADDKARIAILASAFYQPNPHMNLNISPADLKPALHIQPEKAMNRKDINALKEKLALTPNDFSLCRQIGLAYEHLNHRAEAKKYLQMAEKLLIDKKERNPEKSYYYVKLGEVYTALGSYYDACWYFEKAFEINPKDSNIKNLLPATYISFGNYDKATASIQKLMQQWPDDINLLFYSGLNNIYQQIAKYKPSDCAYYRSMAPENFADLSLIKQAAARHGNELQYQLLLNMLNHIVISLKIPMENCSNFNNGEMNTADLLALSDIEDFYIRALQRKEWKNTYKINLALGNLYLLRKEYMRSRTYFDSAIKARPVTMIDQDNNAADAYDYLIASYLMQGDTAKAEQYTRKKLTDKAELYPAARNYTELAAYDLRKNRLAAMDSDLRQALALDSGCVDAYIGYGIFYIRKNEAARAEKYLNVVDKLQPGNASTATLMAITFLQRNNSTTAFKLLKQAMAQNDKNPVIKSLLEYYDVGQ